MNNIIENEFSLTREHRKYRQERVKVLKELNAPLVLIEHEEKLAKMTHSQYVNYCKKEDEKEEKEKAEYRKNNPIDEEIAKLILQRFDLWLEIHKNNVDMLKLELVTGSCFQDPWFFGDSVPGADDRFYKPVLNDDDYWSENYSPIFHSCKHQIEDRLT